MWEVTLTGLLKVAHAAVVAYLAVVVLLRVTGKRTLAKWNAFDFVVTIALGSMLATVILSRDVSLPEGILALVALIVLQLVVTGLSVRLGWFSRVVKAEPALLLRDGRVLHDVLRRERVTVGELHAALRGHGIGSLDDVHAVVLETDGSFSVVQARPAGGRTTLAGVDGYEEDAERAEPGGA